MRPIDKVPRLLLTKQEAATSLGVSVDTFEKHIQHDLFSVRVGRLRLFPPRELERWIAANIDGPRR